MKMLSIAMMTMTVAFAVNTAYGQAATPPKDSSGAQAACCMDPRAQMGQMDERMQRMQALHDKMANATPEERQKLMAEQRQEMQQGMAMMQQMQQGGMMGGAGMSGGMMGGAGMGGPGMGAGSKGAVKGQKPKPMDQKTQMQMMEKRMDMMQMMMQSMMDQQGASGNTMMPAPTK